MNILLPARTETVYFGKETKKVMRKVLLISLLISSLHSFAQPFSPIRKLTVEDGLPSNYVMSITQDKNGFMWLATEAGLSRFDGKAFKTYKKSRHTKNALSANELNKVMADPVDPIIWIATQRSGLNKFDCRTEEFTLFVHDDNDPNSIYQNNITDLCFDRKGNLWVSNYWGGVDYYDKAKNRFIHYNRSTVKQLPTDQVWTIADDHKGHLYIGHVTDGMSILSVKDKTVTNFQHDPDDPSSLPSNFVRSIRIDRFGNVWVGTGTGLALYLPEKQHFIHFKNKTPYNKIFDTQLLKDDKIWIATEKEGIHILDLRNEMFLSPERISMQNLTLSNETSSLSNAHVRCIYQDLFGNIWIGTYGGGVNFISHKPDFFQPLNRSLPADTHTLIGNEALCVCEDEDGQIWTGTHGGGIHVFKEGKKVRSYTKENSALRDNFILSAFKDSKGNLWFGTNDGGVTIYDPAQKTLRPFSPKGFDGKNIRCFYETKDHQICIGTEDRALFLYNPQSGEVKKLLSENSGIPSDNLVRAINQDEMGNLWTGSLGQGLSILGPTYQALYRYDTTNGFYSNTIHCIFKDSRKRMWVGTGEGLILFTGENTFVVYTENDGLENSQVYAIMEDSKGEIWLSTNAGISRFSPTEKKFYNYGVADGLSKGGFMSKSVCKTQKGLIYFGSQNGVYYFDPTRLPYAEKLPPVVLTSFQCYARSSHNPSATEQVAESYTLSSPEIHLSYKQNTFSLLFNVPDYAYAHRLEYAYQLKGLSKEWYDVGSKGEVTFRNLPPGNYTFVVKARLPNQNWLVESTLAHIRINPPFWATWWAKTVYFLLSIGLIVLIVRFYKKRFQLENMLYLEKQNSLQQQRLNDEKLQFFTNITHELRTPLTLIAGPLEDISKNEELTGPIRKKIGLIHQNSTRLMDLINKILDFRKAETYNMALTVRKGDLSKLVREIGLKYSELNQNKDIVFTVTVESEPAILYFDPEKMDTILDNLISNAFKYTDRGSIELILRDLEIQQVSYTEIEVKDTGRGIPREFIPKVFERYYQVQDKGQTSGTGIGLALVKKLAQLHQADLVVDSEEGKGSSFRLRLITNHIYPNAILEDEGMTESEFRNPEEHLESTTHKRIMLIVEDNMDIAHYIEDSFSEEYSILIAKNGKLALETAFLEIPDIVISDIMMPELSGLELCTLLKKDVRTSHIPVVLLTAKTSIQDKTKGYSAGADSYITKPFSSDLLRTRISNLMQMRENLVTLIKENRLGKKRKHTDSLNQIDREFLERLIKIIKEKSYTEELDNEVLAQSVHLSYSTLYRKLKGLTGMTVNEFIRKIKMEYAEELLLTGRYTISEVAFHVGINSIDYFRQCFKKEFGTTPSEHLKRHNPT